MSKTKPKKMDELEARSVIEQAFLEMEREGLVQKVRDARGNVVRDRGEIVWEHAALGKMRAAAKAATKH